MQKYIKILTNPLQVCKKYKPVFGTSDKNGISLDTFHAMYGKDPLYSWIGLDSDEIYAAHKAAGGITSFYRQLGMGCERLVRAILADQFQLDATEVTWSYTYANSEGKEAKLSLDARIDVRFGQTRKREDQILNWLTQVSNKLTLNPENSAKLTGAVFEVRQGYKSADSKRQNADLRNAVRAFNENYLPVVMVLSNQINNTVKRRYTNSYILILSGQMNNDPTECTYAFFKDVVGFDLANFFQENKQLIQAEIKDVLKSLVKP